MMKITIAIICLALLVFSVNAQNLRQRSPSASPSAASRSVLSPLKCRDTNLFNAGYGPCDTYLEEIPNTNHGNCNKHQSLSTKSDAFAFEACPQCGQCQNGKVRLPKCKITTTFDAGHGGCETYANGTRGSNFDYCNTDKDAMSEIFAKDACPQCNQCTTLTTSSEPELTPTAAPTKPECDPRTSAFQSKHGKCNSYALGQQNNQFCRIDKDDSLYQGLYAYQACPECGECNGVMSGPVRIPEYNVVSQSSYKQHKGECKKQGMDWRMVVEGIDFDRYRGQGLSWCIDLCDRDKDDCKAISYSETDRLCDVWKVAIVPAGGNSGGSNSGVASCHIKEEPTEPRDTVVCVPPPGCEDDVNYQYNEFGKSYSCEDIKNLSHLCQRKDKQTGKRVWNHCRASCYEGLCSGQFAKEICSDP